MVRPKHKKQTVIYKIDLTYIVTTQLASKLVQKGLEQRVKLEKIQNHQRAHFSRTLPKNFYFSSEVWNLP